MRPLDNGLFIILGLGVCWLVMVQAAAQGIPTAAAQSVECPAPTPLPSHLPPAAQRKLRQSFEAARRHSRHLWRDTPPFNDDGTVNVFVEIAPGSSEKWEFDMAANRRLLDRRITDTLGGYPVGYGFVPGTVHVDGDPFDGLVLDDDITAGAIVRGRIVGLLHMTDEKGPDDKVVVTRDSREDVQRALLDEQTKTRIAAFFDRYKAVDDDPESFACVAGWGDAAAGRRYVEAAAKLFAAGRP